MTPKMAYSMIYPFIIGLLGAIIYYLYNGKGPEQPLDYFYPRTGKNYPKTPKPRLIKVLK